MTRIRTFILSLAFIACPLLLAEDVPKGAELLKIDFSKTTGLNDYFTSDKIRDTDAQAVRNIDYIRNGNIAARRGFSEFSNTIGISNTNYHGNFLGVFISTTGSKYLIAQIEQKLSYFSAIGGPDVVFTSPTFNHPIDGLNWNGNFYVVSLDTVGIRFQENTGTGVSFVASTSVPRGQFVQSHIDRMLVAGNTATPLRIFYSDADNPDSFPAINTLDLTGVKEYDVITGLGPTLLGSMPIYTNNTTRVLTGTEFPDPATGSAGNVGTRIISDNIGCVHQRTIKNINNRQYFYSAGSNGRNPGIYRFNGISVTEVTKNARHLFSTLAISSFAIPNAPIPNAWVDKDVYCLFIASSGGVLNNYQVCVDENDRASFHEMGINPGSPPAYNALDMVAVSNPTTFGVTGNDVQGDLKKKIYKLDSFSNDYAAIFNWRYKTKDFAMGDQNENRPKVAVRAYTYSQWGSSYVVTANLDFGKSTYSWVINSTVNYNTNFIKTLIFSSGSVVNKLIFPQATRFNYINFDVSGAAKPLADNSVDGIDFYAYPEPQK